MTVPARFSLAFALGLSVLQPWLAPAAEPPACEPSPLNVAPATNQQTADRIAAQLHQSGLLRHYDVDISFTDGLAELSGAVADAGQREQVVRLVQGVAGVERVVDHLTVAETVVPVQAGGVPGTLQGLPPANPVPANPAPQAAPGQAPPEAMPIFQAPTRAA